MGDAMCVLEAEGLCKNYGSVVALHGLDLAVSKGEVCCLLGANGAGKTTAINLFLGFHKPDRGTARIDGIDVNSNPAAARRRVAYLPETVALYEKLTGLENLTFFARVAHPNCPRFCSKPVCPRKHTIAGWQPIPRGCARRSALRLR